MRVLIHRRSIIVVALSVAAMLAVFTIGSQGSVAAADQTMAPGTTLNVQCAGPSLSATASGSTAANLNCSSPPSGISPVGTATTSTSNGTGSPSTAEPTGVVAGDVLVTSVEGPGTSTITCPSGWTQVYNVTNSASGGRYGSSARLVACVVAVGSSAPSLTATVSPAGPASMVTVAYSGVSTSTPVDAAQSAAGATAPSVTTDAAGALAVYSLGGVPGWTKVSAPSGTTLVASTGTSSSEAAAAVETVSAAGPTGTASWSNLRAAVTGTIALRPGAATTNAPAAQDQVTQTTQASGSELSMPAGSTSSVSCDGVLLTTTSTGANTMTLTCEAPATTTTTTTAPPPSTTTTSAPTTTTTSTTVASDSSSGSGGGSSAPSSPPAQICGNATFLDNPTSTPPAGAVVIPASPSVLSASTIEAAGTTYWFAAGTHYLSGKIYPGNNSVYEGATGAILDGTDAGQTSAFGGSSSGVTVEYLTIQNFQLGAGSSVENDDAVNDNLGTNWTIQFDTIQGNGRPNTLNSNGTVSSPGGGYAVGLTTGDVLQYNCLTDNGQGGFNAGRPSGSAFGTGVVISYNEMSDAFDGEALNNYCGCSAGGGKFFFLENATITDNYVHDNVGVPGIWGDTNNTGVVISGNYISNNGDNGIIYEASYNALIQNNTITDNGWARGAQNISQGGGGFPEAGGIYIADSGGDSRIPGGPLGIATVTISGNDLVDNWGGVVVWNDSNRFCGPTGGGDANTCTLGPNASETACVKPGYVFTPNSSNQATYSPSYSAAAGLYWDCRYNAKNVLVNHNTFSLNPANIPGCQAGSPHNTMWPGESGYVSGVDGGECGFVSTVSDSAAGSSCTPTSSTCTGDPYVGDDIENAVAFHENNVFSDNTYIGPWSFQAPEVGDSSMTFAQWQAAPYDQDAGSTLQS